MPRLTPTELLGLLERAWSRETSADPTGWTSDKSAWGQCAVTALVVQDFFGGELLRASLEEVRGYEFMRSHYWNRLSASAELDLSQAQFSKKAYNEIPPGEVRTREYLMASDETRIRFARLRLAVEAELQNEGARTACLSNPIFSDEYYQMCFSEAQLSGCQKMRFGCIVEHRGNIVASTANVPLEPLRHLCEPTCIRFNIQSRTESMLGACAHGEERALDEVRRLRISPRNCTIYIAGFSIENNPWLSRSTADFSCIRCATQLYRAQFGRIAVPVQDHWEFINAEEALSRSSAYALGEKKTGFRP